MLACVWIAAIVYYSNRKEPLNRSFAAASLSAAYMLFYFFMCLQAPDAHTVYLWQKIGSAWYFVMPLFLHFVLIFTEKKTLLKKVVVYTLLYSPAALFTVINLVSDEFIGTPHRFEFGGYSPYEMPQPAPWIWYVMVIWIIVLAVMGIVFFTLYHLRQRDPLKKKVSGTVLVSLSVPVIITILLETLNAFNIKIRIPILEVSTMAWMIAWIGLAIRRYDLFKIDPVKAAESVMAIMPDAVFLVDREGRIEGANTALRDWLNAPEERLAGRPVHELFVTGPASDAVCAALLAATRLDNVEVELRTAGNGSIPVLVSASPLVRRGRTIGMVCVGKDITERKRSEEMLLDLNDRLQRSNRDLQDFASVASHDLQAPLRKISLFSERLKSEDAAGAHGIDFVERIDASVKRMQRLIVDLLAFARLAYDPGTPVRIDLDSVLKEVVFDLEPAIEETGAVVDRGPLPSVTADTTHMRQLFQNLVGNALKFRDRDRPLRVRIRTVDCSRPGFLAVEVEDNGIGIEREQWERIFDAFQRGYGRDRYEGSGLGLAVCRRITERYGGSISVTSRPGEGTAFTVVLPAA